MAETPTEALYELNKLKERYFFLKSEILNLLDEDVNIKNKINDYLKEIKYLEEKYVDLMDKLVE